MDERDGGDDDSGFVSVSCDVDEARWSLSDAEALISEMDPANGVLTLLEATKKAGPKATETPNETRDARLSESLEQTLGGRLVRLVRVPDATTYERQIAALRTRGTCRRAARNPPPRASSARSSPPRGVLRRARVVGRRRRRNAGDLSPSKAFVAGHFAGPHRTSPRRSAMPRKQTSKRLSARWALTSSPPGRAPLGGRRAWAAPAGFDDAQALRARGCSAARRPAGSRARPGRGKTKVVLEIIRRAVASGSRVLACAPSNAAVDNLVERLAEAERDGASVSFVRARARRALRRRAGELARGRARRDRGVLRPGQDHEAPPKLVDATRRGWEKRTARGGGAAERRAVRVLVVLSRRALGATLSRLRGVAASLAISGRKTRAKAEREILANADVVLATTVGAGAENIQKLPAFDMLVLDEAAQATEPAAWIPLVRCARAVLVGDPRQLAPLVRSEEALSDAGSGRPSWPASLSLSRDERRREGAPKAQKRTTRPRLRFCPAACSGCALRTQYRSHAAISDWASRATYGGALAASPSVATRLLRDLPGVVATAATTAPLLLLDTRVASGALLSGCAEATERDLLASLSDYGTLRRRRRDVGGVVFVAGQRGRGVRGDHARRRTVARRRHAGADRRTVPARRAGAVDAAPAARGGAHRPGAGRRAGGGGERGLVPGPRG